MLLIFFKFFDKYTKIDLKTAKRIMPNMTVKQFIKKYFKKLFIGLHEMKKKHERLIDLEMQF